jgi:hypothetical protein
MDSRGGREESKKKRLSKGKEDNEISRSESAAHHSTVQGVKFTDLFQTVRGSCWRSDRH